MVDAYLAREDELEAGHRVVHVEGRVARVLGVEGVDVDVVVQDGADGLLLHGDKLVPAETKLVTLLVCSIVNRVVDQREYVACKDAKRIKQPQWIYLAPLLPYKLCKAKKCYKPEEQFVGGIVEASDLKNAHLKKRFIHC